MATALLSVRVSMSDLGSTKKSNLANAIFHYLEDEDPGAGIFELLADLKAILDEEEVSRLQEVEKIRTLRHFLLGSTIIRGNNETQDQRIN